MNKYVPDYGFGMAPISANMQQKYDLACTGMLSLLSGDRIDPEAAMAFLSEFKGMCNRCIRQDQWDWFTVLTAFGSPEEPRMRVIVGAIPILRRALSEEDVRTMGECLARIEKADARSLVSHFLGRKGESEGGWIYILSTRDSPTTLKIGMTTRTVVERVKEINASTGVLYPWSARVAFRVENPAGAEKEIHARLANFRIRAKREFFELEFREAKRCILEVIEGK